MRIQDSGFRIQDEEKREGGGRPTSLLSCIPNPES
jgi:hypothetical protein